MGKQECLSRWQTLCVDSAYGMHYRQFLTLRRGYSPTDARFIAAATPTAPRRGCPAHGVVLAAFWSRSSTTPQEGPLWVRTKSAFCARCPHPRQSCLGYCAGTTTTCLPAPAAVSARRVEQCANPASERDLLRW